MSIERIMSELYGWESPQNDPDLERIGDFLQADSIAEQAAILFLRRHLRKRVKYEVIVAVMKKTAGIYHDFKWRDADACLQRLIASALVSFEEHEGTMWVALTPRGILALLAPYIDPNDSRNQPTKEDACPNDFSGRDNIC